MLSDPGLDWLLGVAMFAGLMKILTTSLVAPLDRVCNTVKGHHVCK